MSDDGTAAGAQEGAPAGPAAPGALAAAAAARPPDPCPPGAAAAPSIGGREAPIAGLPSPGAGPGSRLPDSQKWFALAIAALAGWLAWKLAPVLTPFAVSALLAYLGDPLVDRLERRGLSRTVAVAVVFLVMLLAGLGLLLVLVPLLQRQVVVMIEMVPRAIAWAQAELLPRIARLPGVSGLELDPEALRSALTSHWQQIGNVLQKLLGNVFQSGQAVLGWVAWLLLIPVVTFYLLRDWDVLMARLRELVPRAYEPTVARLAGECDAVLAEFMRGQFLVMLALATVYTAGLLIVGLDLAFLIGVTAGLVSFVPYLGIIVGVIAAGIAAAIQFGDIAHVVYVVLVFGAGQLLEGMVLSPWLVGDRIGLHPVAVIFAVMAGGQLAGFFGILLALPVAAVVVVLLRHLHERYVASSLYTP